MPMMESYNVELVLRALPTAPEGVVEISLNDREFKGRVEVGEARLTFDKEEGDLRELMETFLCSGVLLSKDGLALGRALAARLFAPQGLGPAWARVQQQRGHRPLRLELVLPGKASSLIDEIPFELLADPDDGGFWFRRPGWSLVRTFEGLRALRYQLPTGSRTLLAWANPAIQEDDGGISTLPEEGFDAHEVAFEREAKELGLDVRASLRRVTAARLAAALREQPETPLLSLVAHGDPCGGALLFHADEGTDNKGDGLLAHDLAKYCRDGGVKVTLLWSCHGARRHVDRSSVAAALLDPERGDGAAVVASPAALEADKTALLVGSLLRSLRDVAGGNLERALAEARHALAGDDLQVGGPCLLCAPVRRAFGDFRGHGRAAVRCAPARCAAARGGGSRGEALVPRAG